MKRLILLSLLIAGCGKGSGGPSTTSPVSPTHGACYSNANGSWQGVVHPTNTVTLTDQCTGTGSVCNEVFTYQPQADGIHAIVIVTQTNGGPNCLPMGASTIALSFLVNYSQISVTVNPSGPWDQDNYNRLSGP